MTVVPIEESDIEPARALRQKFGRFWSDTPGHPQDVYDQFIAATPMVAGVSVRDASDPAPGVWVEPANAAPGRAILFLHGGGYGLGHAKAYAGFVSQIAARTGVAAFALEYPLSSQATAPVARDLAVTTLEKLTAQFASVAVVGDSAGGGLSLATTLEARRHDVAVSSVALFSPWTDLTLSSGSTRDFAVGDPLLDVAYLQFSAAAYAGAIPTDDPRVSPLFDRDLKLLPPTLAQVGADEVLLDDSRHLAAAASQVRLEVWQGMHHVFQLNTNELVSARRALDIAAAFLSEHWG